MNNLGHNYKPVLEHIMIIAGRIPALKMSADKKICPSVIEITLVGI